MMEKHFKTATVNKYNFCDTSGSARPPADPEAGGVRQVVPHPALPVAVAEDLVFCDPPGKRHRVNF